MKLTNEEKIEFADFIISIKPHLVNRFNRAYKIIQELKKAKEKEEKALKEKNEKEEKALKEKKEKEEKALKEKNEKEEKATLVREIKSYKTEELQTFLTNNKIKFETDANKPVLLKLALGSL